MSMQRVQEERHLQSASRQLADGASFNNTFVLYCLSLQGHRPPLTPVT